MIKPRNMMQRRARPVTAEEVFACASGKACCNGRGWIERRDIGAPLVTGEDGKEQPPPSRKLACPCAVRRFDAAHPEVIIDQEGNAWWPEPTQAEPRVPVLAAAEEAPPGKRGADAERRRAHVAKLLGERDDLRAEVAKLDDEVASLVSPEMEERVKLETALVKSGQREQEFLELAGEQDQLAEKLVAGIARLHEKIVGCRLMQAEHASEAADCAEAQASLAHAIEILDAEVVEKTRALRKRRGYFEREIENREERVRRIGSRLDRDGASDAA